MPGGGGRGGILQRRHEGQARSHLQPAQKRGERKRKYEHGHSLKLPRLY